ncbi:class I adenylate cyclase [Thorsellia kenyensis]|uniref:Adenylate cyclase n=1 Tax=Thorsellia kenyensis TaxID=1549888 RepID=A0ABV6CCA7_9GAMM
MQIYLERLKQRIDAINQLRIERALEGMPAHFCLVYQLIPLFLHYEHPAMPGYLLQGSPHGITGFQPNNQDIALLLQEVDSLLNDPEFSFHTFSANKVSNSRENNSNWQAPIIAVYSMGSTSYLGQNQYSDLDIWVCHQSWLSESELEQLAHKCSLLELWASNLGVDLTLFLVDENRFRHKLSGELDNDDCGTSQHYLLLDEFYRSAVRLAGKRLLWYLIPKEEESHYDEYVTYLYSHGVLKPNEWLDLGGVGAMSAREYFGASLWQLYKSIDSPYKSVIKSLLLEAYFAQSPKTTLLAIEIKDYLQQGDIIASGLDAYLFMLKKISDYLISNEDFDRLEFIRRCFYLKINDADRQSKESLASGTKENFSSPWRRKLIAQLVKSWGWSEEKVAFLDNRAHWKIEEVKEAYDEILVAVMESYRNLIRFARQHDLSVSASPRDISILTRKLYAAYEQLPGKITLINPQISPDISEKHLTYVYVPKGRVNRTGWYLFNRAPYAKEMLGARTIEYSFYLSKLILSSYLNGLWIDETVISLFNQTPHQHDKILRFYQDLKKLIPKEVESPSPTDLYAPAEIRDMLVVLNLEKDPTIDYLDEIHFATEQQGGKYLEFNDSTLSYELNGELICLVGSVDIIYRNSWNEMRTLHFNQQFALIDALESILSKMHQYAIPPKNLDVVSYGHYENIKMAEEVKTIFMQSINLRLIHAIKDETETVQQSIHKRTPAMQLSPDDEEALYLLGRQTGVKLIVLGQQIFGLFFERLGVKVKQFEHTHDIFKDITEHKLEMLSHNKSVNTSSLIGIKQHNIPQIIESYACEGIIQFFFETLSDSRYFNTYILDERNALEVYYHCEGSQEALVNDVSRFYSASHERFTLSSRGVSFNLPQFYHVKTQGTSQIITPYE